MSIAHYRVTSKLGEGGMGEVWRGTDTKLNRTVAIKVLPDSLAAVPDRMARFRREAQVLASLNHPNIATIYGVEEGALVMELVEGVPLAGPAPEETALPIIHQLIDALEYAHEKGIIHRDLKPANIKITPEGRVKVLDFGLAKAITGDAAPAGDPVASPTLTMQATMAGVIMGTAAYMAPEQARAQNVDKRADIWAFGVVLYELLTGRKLFDGPTVSDTLAGVLRQNLDFREAPIRFHRLLRRCLERDARKRLRDIGDARAELEEPVPAAPVRSATAVRRLPWIVTAVLAVAAAGLSAIHFREAPSVLLPVRFTVPPPEKGSFGPWLSFSPDGQYLAFTGSSEDGVSRLWLRSMASLQSRPLPGTEGTVTAFWSPDSRFIAFQTAGKLKKMDISGGPPQTLCDATGVLLGGSWNRDGVILFGSNSGVIRQVSSAGGVPSPVTQAESSHQEGNHSDPVFLADGRHFIYLRRSSLAEYNGVFVGSLGVKPEEQSAKRIQVTDFSPAYAPPAGGGLGHLLFLRDGTLMAQPFDERGLQTAGEPFPIAENVGTSVTRGSFTVSANGSLAFHSAVGVESRFTWLDRGGRPLGRVGDPGEYAEVALSPDGGRVAYTRPSGGTIAIWLLDLARNVNSRLTFQQDGARTATWSPDGKYVAFASSRESAIYVRAAAGSGSEEPLIRSGSFKFVSHWSPDGRFLLYTEAKNGLDILAIADPLAPGVHKPIPFLDAGFNETEGQFSPDSRWVAYASDESGRYEIYVSPFPRGGDRRGKWLVSTSGGVQPRWRRDGKELFYVSQDNKLMAVTVDTEPSFRSETPHALFDTSAPPYANVNTVFRYDVSKDGSRFLLPVPSTTVVSLPTTVVLNWRAELKR
jgi:eukaryotic-like serine/threonine-protein kinase